MFLIIKHDIFRLFLDDFIVVYLDNILIYSKNYKIYIQFKKTVIEILENKKLFVKFYSYQFF